MTIRLLPSLALLALVGCGASVDAEKKEPFILYSLHGNDVEPDKRPKTAEQFHSFPVLGKVEIANADSRKEILAALQAGMGKGERHKCFWPRHGIRVVSNGQATDYVICFECGLVSVFGGSNETKSTDTSAAVVFNRYLKDVGVPEDRQSADDK